MKKWLLFSLLFLFLVNCEDSDDSNFIAIDCTEVACTENFVTLIVTVTDDLGVAVSLDRFEVLDKDSSENLTTELNDSPFQIPGENGQYPLYNDSFVFDNQNTERTLTFTGFINDQRVAEAEFVVETDCCHVSLGSGDVNIVIN